MSDDPRADRPLRSGADGDLSGGSTAAAGTPVPVDLALDRRSRTNWVVFAAGPVIWFAHFTFVYLVAEAGCTGSGPGLERFDPPVPVTATIVATVVAVLLCAATTWWAWRWWRDGRREAVAGREPSSSSTLDDEGRSASLGFAGAILSAFSLVAVLFTAAPAVVLGPC